jgi:hypothetical protein
MSKRERPQAVSPFKSLFATRACPPGRGDFWILKIAVSFRSPTLFASSYECRCVTD